MSSDKEKAAFEQAAKYLNKFMSHVDGIEDGLMKVHEGIGYVAEKVDEFAAAMQEGVMHVAEMLDEYREGVWDAAAAEEKRVYPEQTLRDESLDGCPAPDAKPVKPTADMSRSEKIDFLIKEYSLPDTRAQHATLEACTDQTLTQAVDILRRRLK